MRGGWIVRGRQARCREQTASTSAIRLREARLAAGLSQSELEELSGIPKARLSRYENGHVEPSIQTLARLARALNVSEASLLGDQRAVLEDFFAVLAERGVQIQTKEQGKRLAAAVADMVQALGGIESVAGPAEPTESSVDWTPAAALS